MTIAIAVAVIITLGETSKFVPGITPANTNNNIELAAFMLSRMSSRALTVQIIVIAFFMADLFNNLLVNNIALALSTCNDKQDQQFPVVIYRNTFYIFF